jgi:hypothetical protein
MLAIGAVAELLQFLAPDEEDANESLWLLQKRIKYGLATTKEIAIYEMGFSDRIIANDLAESVAQTTRAEIRREIRQKRRTIVPVMAKYPSYFQEILARIIS